MQQPASSRQAHKNGYQMIHRMKKLYISLAAALIAALPALSQSSQDFLRKYNLLVSQVGPGGVGVETLLDNWAKADQDNADMLTARYNCYLTKAQSTEIITRKEKKYLGLDPILSLQDSTGTPMYYFQILKYDDELFGEAVKAVDRAIDVYPGRLEYRFMKANAYVSYERESPDMALANLISLVEEYSRGDNKWTFEGEVADDEFFAHAMQEYCITFHTLATPSSYEAFRKLSEAMLQHYPARHVFRSNIGTYYMQVEKNYKTALKYYGQVLKKVPDDYTSIANSLIAARKLKNRKLEKKYMDMLQKLER